MAQGNLTWQRGDITGDIYLDYLRPQNQDPVPYVRLYLMIDGSPESKPVKGLRVLIYGTLAELVYGHVQKGSRIGVEGHVQLRLGWLRQHLVRHHVQVSATGGRGAAPRSEYRWPDVERGRGLRQHVEYGPHVPAT